MNAIYAISYEAGMWLAGLDHNAPTLLTLETGTTKRHGGRTYIAIERSLSKAGPAFKNSVSCAFNGSTARSPGGVTPLNICNPTEL